MTNNNKNIFMFRHGQTDWNVVDKFQGWSDIPLNNTGIVQAYNLSAQLNDVKFEVMYSSPLSRAMHTAKIVLNGRPVRTITDNGFKERNFGEYEGKFMKWTTDVSHVSVDTSKDTIVLMSFNELEKHIPGGESMQDMKDRVWNTLYRIVSNTQYKTIGIAAHYGPLVAVLQNILGQQNIQAIHMPNCGYINLRFDGKKLSLAKIPEWVKMVNAGKFDKLR